MRVASICKSLHVLPRAGGVLDQPAREVRLLESIFASYAKWEKHEDGKRGARDKNRKKFSGPVGEALREELRGH